MLSPFGAYHACMDEVTTTKRGALPYLYFEDVAAAIDWLTSAFGMSERFRIAGPDGIAFHAELELEGSVVMLGALGAANADAPTDRVRCGVYAFVSDVDHHHSVAKAAGAQILSEPATQPFGDRIYLTRDLEGHEWYFAQYIQDVSVNELREILGSES